MPEFVIFLTIFIVVAQSVSVSRISATSTNYTTRKVNSNTNVAFCDDDLMKPRLINPKFCCKYPKLFAHSVVEKCEKQFHVYDTENMKSQLTAETVSNIFLLPKSTELW
jgi:hypothetical protein